MVYLKMEEEIDYLTRWGFKNLTRQKNIWELDDAKFYRNTGIISYQKDLFFVCSSESAFLIWSVRGKIKMQGNAWDWAGWDFEVHYRPIDKIEFTTFFKL
jgi:hypothetical protein